MNMPTRTATALALAAALAGCASLQPQTPEQQAQARAEARWAALMKGDFERAWTYADEATRTQTPQGMYKDRFGSSGAWKDASVYKVTCQPERCLVRIVLVTQNLVPNFASAIPTLKTSFDEEWVREDGQWWYRGLQTSRVGSIEPEPAPAAPAPPR